MADNVELKPLQQNEQPTPSNYDENPDVFIQQPDTPETITETQPLNESNERSLQERRMSTDERRIKGRKERERRRLKQLEEDEIRRRERRKRKRQQASKNQKSVFDHERRPTDKEADKLNQEEDFERTMDKTLDSGDLDEIKEMITAHKLTKCKTNSLEKTLEVSYKVKHLAQTNGPDAEDFNSLANTVEEFAIKLLEPLKGDDMKRAIFEGEDFDRIAEKTVLFHQKKFVSHPVVYNLLMKRWAGSFHHLRYSFWFDLKTLKWFLLNVWTAFDVVLFPLVFVILYLVHLVIGLVKKRQEFHAIVILSGSSRDSLEDMQDLSSACFAIWRPPKYSLIYEPREWSTANELSDQVQRAKNVEKNESHENSLIASLKSAEKMIKHYSGNNKKKVLIVMTDDGTGEPIHNVTRVAQRIKYEGVHVISVGFGVHPEMKELETMATSENDVILYHGEVKLGDIVQKMLQSINGYDIFDRYTQYFVTPYFIFVRDTLSYLVLLGLHFAMCLQPSTLHFTTLEWVILCFFIGRLLIEIYQAGMERNSSDKLRHTHGIQRNDNSQLRKAVGSLQASDDELNERESQLITEQRKQRKARSVFLNMMYRYLSDWWNALDLVTLAVYVAILMCRSFTWAEHLSVSKNRLLAVAGYLYGLNAMFLTLRVFGHIMESSNRTGSTQIALFQVMGAVIAIFGQFIAAIIAFSLAITKVYVAEMSYNSATNSSSHGFCEAGGDGIDCWFRFATHLIWSLLGDPQADPLKSSDATSDLLAKLLYGLFLIMAVVMLMNMMIALLSNTYQAVEDNAFYEWSYRKATTIRTYKNYHPVPVPFNIISLAAICIWRIFKFICCSECCAKTKRYREKKHQSPFSASFFDCLVFDLQAEYFSTHGYAFPMSESSKMDRLLRETEGNRQLIGHIADKVFKYNKKEAKRLTKDMEDQLIMWDTGGINIKGHQLTYVPCQCMECNVSTEQTRYHGARFQKSLSKEWPGFEVLIQEIGDRRLISVGVVSDNWYNPHVFPGWEGNSIGYHVDVGKIFDISNQKVGIDCEGAMAHRGDLIGCKILYDRPSRDHTLTVSFTLNGRVIGEGSVKDESGTTGLYPYVGMGWDGISLLFKLCSSQHKETSRLEKDNFGKHLIKIYDKIDNLQSQHEHRETMLLKTIADLENKLGQVYDQCKSLADKDTLNTHNSNVDLIESSAIDSAL